MRLTFSQSQWNQGYALRLCVALLASAIPLSGNTNPVVESLTPSSGSGDAKTFEFIVYDADDAAEITGMQPLFSAGAVTSTPEIFGSTCTTN